MLTKETTSGLGEKVAVAGAAVLAVSSFLPYWASITWETTDTFVLLGGPTRFNVWDSYPTPVLVAVALSFVILVLGLARLLAGKPSTPPALVYAATGAVITLLLLYGIWEGPQGLFQNPILGGSVSGAFFFERGPLLYVGLVAALAIVVGGVLARRSANGVESRRTLCMRLDLLLIADVALVLFTLVLALRRHPGGIALFLPALLIAAAAAWVLWLIANDDDGLSGLAIFPMSVLLTLLTFPLVLVNVHHARRPNDNE